MRIGGGGSADMNLLLSDAAQYRNEDFVSSEGRAFVGGIGVSNVAAQYGYGQLFNPAASGVVVLLDKILVAASAATPFSIDFDGTARTTDVGAWAATLQTAAAGAAHLRRETNAVLDSTTFVTTSVLADTPTEFVFRYPLLIPANMGLSVWLASVNVLMRTTFFGREV